MSKFDSLVLLKSYAETKFNKKRFSSRRELEEWQNRKMQPHLEWVRENSPFYRNHWKDYELKDWRFFPTIDKKTMMANFKDFNTKGISAEKAYSVAFKAEESRDFSPTIGDVTVGLSSGTSGHRGIFLCTTTEQNTWAGSMLAKILARNIWNETRIAFFLRANSNLYQSVEKGKISFQYFDMLKPISDHCENLNDLNPTVIIAPPQVLRQLVKLKEDGELTILPEKIVSVAETLDPLDEKIIGDCFKQRIHQGYQATEGFLATTCSEGHLHLNEDILVIEKEFLPGSKTKFMPILSDFRRKTQPMIRYALNDVLETDEEPCPCGSVLQRIKAIEGRMDDVFLFRRRSSTEELQEVYPDFIRRSILKTSTPLQEYKIEQSGVNQLKLGMEFENSISSEERQRTESEVKANLGKLAAELDCKPPELEFIDYEAPEKGSKLRRIIRSFSPDVPTEQNG